MSGRRDIERDVGACWEAYPRVLGQAREPVLTEGELFDAACAAAARRAALPDPQDVRVFAGESIVNPSMVEAYLPTPADGCFAAYADRLRNAAGSFALTINSLQQFGWELWRALRRRTDPVLGATGSWSAGGVDCHVIASAYGTAPTLIHKDTAGVLTYVLSGFKRYYTWPYEVFGDIAGDEAMQRQVNLPSSIRYTDHVDTATVVEGGPGSVLYWPSDRWHCATSDGELAVSLHIAHYQWDDRLALLLRRVQRLAAAELGVGRFAGGGVGPAVGDGHPVDAHVHATVSRLIDDPAADLELRLRRLKRLTASNFEVVPRFRPCPDLRPGDPLTVPATSAVATLTADGDTYLAVNGHVLRTGGGGWLEDFLHALTPGATHPLARWGELLHAAGGPTRSAATVLIRELVRRGALDGAVAA